jgi:excisionase family DNA binding protein
MEPVLVDDDEASRLLGISRSKFHTLVANGIIPRLKIGRSARYRPADLLAFTERLRADAAGEHDNRIWTPSTPAPSSPDRNL